MMNITVSQNADLRKNMDLALLPAVRCLLESIVPAAA
jgi:hypothetical protein